MHEEPLVGSSIRFFVPLVKSSVACIHRQLGFASCCCLELQNEDPTSLKVARIYLSRTFCSSDPSSFAKAVRVESLRKAVFHVYKNSIRTTDHYRILLVLPFPHLRAPLFVLIRFFLPFFTDNYLVQMVRLNVSLTNIHCYKTDGEIPVHTHDDAGRQRSTTGKYFPYMRAG